uniref:Uncharacterized protein LOC104238655 n=1 Tax=Nicotiana sylvestris TaxID=4096 RepID=A0A1U7XWR9_NICSY|nr:PREDICTED: uncharacterized protein LOC104238655 [Nicotiana sylvestris]
MADDFKERVKHSWEAEIAGNKLFKVIGKMNILKAVLTKLNKKRFSIIERKAEHAMEELKRCQTELQGVTRRDPDKIAQAFIEFYKTLLGEKDENMKHVCSELVRKGSTLSHAQSKDVVTGVLEFFQKGTMPKSLNSTMITLVLKNSHAEEVGDYRPIACCNTLFKIISKMLCMRLKTVLPKIISANQSAFVAGRSIVQNVLICQDLVRLYKRKAFTRSCLIKIDLRKAYDTVEWDFVQEMLHALNFPRRFIQWIMQCITTTKYSIAISVGIYGNIEGKIGLRQVDPISPIIFVICMECFTRIMQHVATM